MKPNRNESNRQQQAAEDALFDAVIALRDVSECRNFFKDLCTPAELQALVDRWHVVELLRGLADRFPQVVLITHIDSVREGVDRVLRVELDQASGAALVSEDQLVPGGGDVAA